MTSREYFESIMEKEIIGETELSEAIRTGEVKSMIKVGENQSINNNTWIDYNINGWYKISVLFKNKK
jgi:hypothetical protein